MMGYFRRILRDCNKEGWLVYSHSESSMDIDRVIILFGEKVNNIYLFSESPERLSDQEYLYAVCDLVHDLPTEFKLHMEKIEEPEDDDVDLFEELLNRVMADNDNSD